jgi:hypothetical protein
VASASNSWTRITFGWSIRIKSLASQHLDRHFSLWAIGMPRPVHLTRAPLAELLDGLPRTEGGQFVHHTRLPGIPTTTSRCPPHPSPPGSVGIWRRC